MNDSDLSRAVYAKPGHLIRRLQQIAVAVFLEETAPFDMTPVQYAALTAIGARPGIDQIRLAHAIGFDRTTIGGVVERLEAKGLITRETAAADRRAKLLRVTEAGQAALAAMAPAVERVQDRILGGLGVEERPLFVDMLARLVKLNNEVARVPLAAPRTE